MSQIRFRWRVDHRGLPVASLAALMLLLCADAAQACNVPVFRFALERWRADAYRVTIFHREPLSATDQKLLARLESQRDQSLSNLTVRALDVARLEDAADQALLESLADTPLPLLTVQYPASLQIESPVWSHELTADAAARLLDSAVRQQILDRIVEGETAVWLLLESGDAAKDDPAAELLEQQLARLARDLQLPQLTDLSEDDLFAKTPLKLSFSMLRIPRTESESPLVQMLLRCEPDLRTRSDPMIFPVFGRGRALLPLIGAGITADNIANSAAFLVGACSCEVKELNPGFDLLLSADWDQLLSVDGQRLPIVATRALPLGEPELVPIPAGGGESIAAAAGGKATRDTATVDANNADIPAAPATDATSDAAAAHTAAASAAGAKTIRRSLAFGAGLGVLVALLWLVKRSPARSAS